MKKKIIVFISNFLEHHSLPLCESFINANNDVYYISTCKTPKKRLAMGYDDMNEIYNFVIPVYKGVKYKKIAKNIIKKADLVIYDGVWGKWYSICKRNKIPTMRISERFLKGNVGKVVKTLKIFKYYLLSFREKNTLLLCCGKYAAEDFRLTKHYSNNMLKFGYFPKTEIVDYNSCSKIDNTIIWVGRLIDWKHPELICSLSEHLASKNISFKIGVVGGGAMFNAVKEMVNNNKDISDKVDFYGPLNHVDVRKKMKQATIHILTSDSNEGWGAVLNESMNSYCIPVANSGTGASTYLIKDKVNGFCFNDEKSFFEIIENLLTNKEQNTEIAFNAYRTIVDKWNSDVCIERILKLLEFFDGDILAKKEIFNEGPLSLEKV